MMEENEEKVKKTLAWRLFLYERAKGLHLGRRCCFLRPSISMERCLLGMGIPGEGEQKYSSPIARWYTGSVLRKSPTPHQCCGRDGILFSWIYCWDSHKMVPQGVHFDTWSCRNGLRGDPSEPPAPFILTLPQVQQRTSSA